MAPLSPSTVALPTRFAPALTCAELVIWGLLVVPSSMDRSDGAKSVLFPSQVPKLQATLWGFPGARWWDWDHNCCTDRLGPVG